MDSLLRGEDPDLELFMKNIQPNSKSSGNAALSWQWRERGLNPPNAVCNKRVLEDAAEDHLVYKENLVERAYQLPGHPRSTFLMVFSPDGTKVASTHGNHMVYVSEMASGKHVRTLMGHPRTPWCIAFHPSHTQIIGSGCLGGQVRVWDLSGGSEVWAVGSVTVIASIAFHPRDKLLVIATHNELYFWDWSQPQPFTKICTNNVNEKVRYVSFDSLGHKLITGISVWPSPEPVGSVVRVFTSSPLAAAQLQQQQQVQVAEERSTLAPPPTTNGLSSAHLQMVTSYQSLVQRYDTLVRNYHRLFLASQSTNTTDRGTDPMEEESDGLSRTSRSPLIGSNPLIGGAARHTPRASNEERTESPTHSTTHHRSNYRHINWYDGLTSNRRRRSNRLFDRDEGIIPRQLQEADPETRHRFSLVLDRLQSFMENSIEETLEFWKRYEASRTPDEPNILEESAQPSSSRPDTSCPPRSRHHSLENVEQRSMLREFLARRHAARVAERNRTNNTNDNSDASYVPSTTQRSPRYRHFSASDARERYRLDRIANSDRTSDTIARWLQLIRNIIQNSGSSLRTAVNEMPDLQMESSLLRGQHSDLYQYLNSIERSESEQHGEHESSSDSDSSDHVHILRTRNRSVAFDQQSNTSTNDPEQEDNQETVENTYSNIQSERVESAQSDILPGAPSLAPTFDDHPIVNYRMALRKIRLSIEALRKHSESLSALWAVDAPHPTLGQIRSSWENLHREIISLFRSPTGDSSSGFFTRSLSARCRMLNTTNSTSSSTQRVPAERDEAVSSEHQLTPSQQMENQNDLNDPNAANSQRGNRVNDSSESSSSSSDSSSETDNDNNLPSTSSGVTTPLFSRKKKNQTSPRVRSSTSARIKGPTELATRLRTPPSEYTRRHDRDFRRAMHNTTFGVIQHSQHTTQSSQTTSSNSLPEAEHSSPNVELNITRYGVRFCAKRLINIIINMMMDCLEDENLSSQLNIIIRILKKSLGLTCLLLMTENIITHGRTESENESQPSTSGAAPRAGPFRNNAPVGPFARGTRFFNESSEDTLFNSHRRRLDSQSVDEQIPSTSRGTIRTNRDRFSKRILRRCPSQQILAGRNLWRPSSHDTPQTATHDNSSQTTNSKKKSKRTQDPGVPTTSNTLSIPKQVAESRKPVQSEGSGAAELSDRIAVQISAVNKNNSNVAQNRRDLYNQRRRQMAAQRYNPLSGRNKPNPPRHRRDERTQTAMRNNARSVLRRRRIRIDGVATLPRVMPNADITENLDENPVAGLNHEEARVAGIQERLRNTPRISPYGVRMFGRHGQVMQELPEAHSDSADTDSDHPWATGELQSMLRNVTVPLVRVNDVPLDQMNNVPLLQGIDVPLGELVMAQPHHFVQPIIVAQNALLLDEEEMPANGLLEPSARIVSDPLASPVHRVQTWDFTNGAIPDITDATKNVVVQKCKIHNDASIDISKDGRMLVALLPPQRIRNVTHRLGVYSLEWSSLGVCLYSTLLEQNAVSVALSPCARHLAVGLGSRRVTFLPSGRSRSMAVIFKLQPSTNKEPRAGRLITARVIEQNWESGFTSLNCLRWAPTPGQGFVYANNTGQLKIKS